MVNFKSNPIVVKENGIPCHIIPLALDVEENDFILEILDANDTLLYRYEMNETSMVSIEKDLEVVTLVYKDYDGTYITKEVINLLSTGEVFYVDNRNEDFESILQHMVKEDMDFPSGTKAEIANHTEMLKKATENPNARMYVTSRIRNTLVASNLVKSSELEGYVYNIYSNLYGMGILQELDDDSKVGEIMVNASVFPRFKSDIYYIKEGRKVKYNKEFKDLVEMRKVFDRAVEFNKKELNSVENAIVEATRANKDRVNILIPDASENYILNIRKFSNFVPNKDMMKKSGTVNEEIERLLEVLVQGKANIGIGGAMGTGKTSFINYLLTSTEPIERKVVIASVSETDVERVLKGHDIVILNVDDEKGFTFEKQIRASLRTTASRIIIPESRGGEFKQVYEANLKTKGNMFTAHALDDESFLDMCVDMYMSSNEGGNENSEYIKNKLSKSIDIIIVMRKVGDDIRVKSISEILLDEKRQFAGMNVLFEWDFDPETPLDGRYVHTGNKLSENLKKRLNENGVPMSQLRDL